MDTNTEALKIEREAFDKWYGQAINKANILASDFPEAVVTKLREVLWNTSAALSQPPAVQMPPGFKLVPIDPDAMQVARGELAFLDAEEYPDGADVRECQVIDIYRAMVDVFPSPAAVRVEETPLEPTHEMCMAACDVLLTDWWQGEDSNGKKVMQIRECSAHDIYKAMIAVAPSPAPKKEGADK